MMTDDELIERIRTSLKATLTIADPPPNLLPQLRAELAGDGRASRSHAGGWRLRTVRRRLRRGLAVVPVLLAIGAAFAIVAFALISLSHRHPSATSPAPSPSAPPPYISPNDPAMKYVMPVTNPNAQYPACRMRGPLRPVTGSPLISHAAPTELLSILGVLRRPATPSDKLPAFFAHRTVAEGSAQVIYVDYIRLARVQDGIRYYLIPIVSASGFGISPGCAAAQVAALDRRLPQIPAALRTRAQQVLADLIAQRRYHSQPHQEIWELDVNAGGGSGHGGGGGTASDISQQGTMSSYGANGTATLSGVVPDGVATITLRFSRTPAQGAAFTTTTRPINNVFVIRIPRAAPNAFPQTILWHSAQRRLIKTLSENDS
jgi:hypothetical protein